LFHILKERDATKNDMSTEKFIGEKKRIRIDEKDSKIKRRINCNVN